MNIEDSGDFRDIESSTPEDEAKQLILNWFKSCDDGSLISEKNLLQLFLHWTPNPKGLLDVALNSLVEERLIEEHKYGYALTSQISMANYFTLEAVPLGKIPGFLFILKETNELHLSPHVRLSGFDKMAHIESEALAEEFKEACLPRLKKRYGEDFDLNVVEMTYRENPSTLERIKRDSEIIKKRLATKNFASNKPLS